MPDRDHERMTRADRVGIAKCERETIARQCALRRHRAEGASGASVHTARVQVSALSGTPDVCRYQAHIARRPGLNAAYRSICSMTSKCHSHRSLPAAAADHHIHGTPLKLCENLHQVPLSQIVLPPATPTVHVRRTEPVPTVVFDTYWRFATKRQQLYFSRLRNEARPWTTDPILLAHRFTNAYRAADRVSQYLIGNVVYGGDFSPQDAVFRTLLFKIFNRIETWELLTARFGEPRIDTFDVDNFDRALRTAIQSGSKVYSAAYIMPNAPRRDSSQTYKHRTHLELLAHALHTGTHERALAACSLRALYEVLRELPSIGPFLAYQYAIDLAYSEHVLFDENDFVQPGPGALNGLAKCFSSLGDYSPEDAIAWVTDRQEDEFRKRGLEFQTLWGRPLHLIDCQNLFCEVDKYARVAHPEFSHLTGRARIKQSFSPRGIVPRPWFPPKWKLNDAITRDLGVATRVAPGEDEPGVQMTLNL